MCSWVGGSQICMAVLVDQQLGAWVGGLISGWVDGSQSEWVCWVAGLEDCKLCGWVGEKQIVWLGYWITNYAAGLGITK